MPDGLLVVDKPAGPTSHDVVARVRRLAGTRKVGHAGTLDPMATGVLVLGLGRGTRLLGHLVLTDKEYAATIRLGERTLTDDAEGPVIRRADASRLDPAVLARQAGALTGALAQVPSAVSAVKVGGRRSYERVRAGEQVDLAPRQVVVRRFDVTAARPAGRCLDVDVEVACSSGTYVRGLARDLGEALGVGGHLIRLRRTRVGPYGLEHARTIEQLAADLDVTPLGEAAAAGFPVVRVGAGTAARLAHGMPIPATGRGAAPVAVLDADGALVALVHDLDGLARPLAVFVG